MNKKQKKWKKTITSNNTDKRKDKIPPINVTDKKTWHHMQHFFKEKQIQINYAIKRKEGIPVHPGISKRLSSHNQTTRRQKRRILHIQIIRRKITDSSPQRHPRSHRYPGDQGRTHRKRLPSYKHRQDVQKKRRQSVHAFTISTTSKNPDEPRH